MFVLTSAVNRYEFDWLESNVLATSAVPAIVRTIPPSVHLIVTVALELVVAA